jgi:hypothetical protein
MAIILALAQIEGRIETMATQVAAECGLGEAAQSGGASLSASFFTTANRQDRVVSR